MRNGKFLFFIILVLMLVALFTINYIIVSSKYLDSVEITLDNLEKIKSSREEYNEKIELFYDGNIIPYSTNDNFYLLHIENIDDYKKVYIKEDFKIKVIKQTNNHLLELLLYNDKYYKIINLELTNLPVMYIDENNLLNMYGFDNIEKLNCEYTVRGDSSKYSEKKGYKLNLYDRKNKEFKVSLLNMNSSSSWILNPIFFDNSYMREKISYDLWNILSLRFYHKLEYVELILGDNYQGLYYLQEKVDMDTFAGNKINDLLFFTKNWKKNIANVELDTATIINNKLIDEFEIEEGLEGNYKMQIDLLKSYNASLLDETEIYDIEYDLINMIDYGLFLNLTMTIDNTYKNQKIILKNMKSYYLLQKTVWDLDWTFNNENINKFYPDLNTSIDIVNIDLGVPISLKENQIYQKISKIKYFLFRLLYYNGKNMNKIINKYRTYLESYGANLRDSNKWNNINYDESINNIYKFISERIKILDSYYGGL